MYHYVYRITNKLLKKHYYGARSTHIEPKRDIGIVYFSSSKSEIFISDQQDNPNNFKYKVIKIFETRREALLYETFLHEKFNVSINNNFYSDNTTFKQSKDNAVIISIYNILSNLSDEQQEVMKETGILDIKRYIETNILAKDKDIIHLSNTKIQQRKWFRQYFKLRREDIDIVNEFIYSFVNNIKGNVFSNPDFGLEIKYICKRIFPHLLSAISDKSKSFKRILYQYVIYLLSDIELYNPKYKYGKQDTKLLNDQETLYNKFKSKLSIIRYIVLRDYPSYTNNGLNTLEKEYKDFILEKYKGTLRKALAFSYKNLLSLSVDSISDTDDLVIKYVASSVLVKEYKNFIKDSKSKFSSKTCAYKELYV